MTIQAIRVSVPDGDLPELKLLSHVKPMHLGAIRTSLSTQTPTLDVDMLSRTIAEQASLDFGLVEHVVSMLWRLAILQRRLEQTPSEFLEALGSSLQELGDGEWSKDDVDAWAARQPVINEIMSCHAISLGAKAATLLMDQQSVFFTAQLLTDVRPVFDETAEAIIGLLPLHTLAIGYRENGEMRDMHFSMDLNDVIHLRELLDRAIRKESLIRNRLGEASLTVIETGGQAHG